MIASKVAPTEGMAFMKSSSRVCKTDKIQEITDVESSSSTEGKGKKSLHGMDVQDASLMHTEQSTLTPLLELQKNQRKRKSESYVIGSRDPGHHLIEVVSNSSSAVSSKRQQNSGITIDGGSFSKSVNRKINQYEAARDGLALYERINSVLGSEKIIKKVFPITAEIENSTVKAELSNSDEGTTDNGNKEDLQLTRLYSIINSHLEDSVLLPAASYDLKILTVEYMRNIGKRYRLKCTNLAKLPLLKLLVDKLPKSEVLELLASKPGS
ncbi:hypothetical protein O6P43_006479 [Quillaja saponaria]|uniref:Uncharacterized protein n=1 Tax=Quillaja saponaria TaxID=32244 RepID=A0AAD7Q8A8_QUISA|nr:hypothetical protein O6P43_006479 [Quillaja saponaria]